MVGAINELNSNSTDMKNDIKLRVKNIVVFSSGTGTRIFTGFNVPIFIMTSRDFRTNLYAVCVNHSGGLSITTIIEANTEIKLPSGKYCSITSSSGYKITFTSTSAWTYMVIIDPFNNIAEVV